MRPRASGILRYCLLALIVGAVVGGAVILARRPVPGPPPEMTTAALGDFAFDQSAGTVADVPQALRRLDGRRVVVLGEMWNPDQDGKTWMLTKLPTHGEHRPPLVQQFVFCRSTSPVRFLPDEVRATGVLHISAVRQGERVVELYQLDVEDVRPRRGPT